MTLRWLAFLDFSHFSGHRSMRDIGTLLKNYLPTCHLIRQAFHLLLYSHRTTLQIISILYWPDWYIYVISNDCQGYCGYWLYPKNSTSHNPRKIPNLFYHFTFLWNLKHWCNNIMSWFMGNFKNILHTKLVWRVHLNVKSLLSSVAHASSKKFKVHQKRVRSLR